MKECISEQDHYRIFPPRLYSFDEECDLIETGGDELAYCICQRNFCNMKNIIDQFIDFEQNHPEIFDAINDKNDEEFLISSQSYPTQLNYQSNRNTPQKETNIHYEKLKPIRSDKRSNDDDFEENNSNHANTHSISHQIYDTSRISHQISNFPSMQNYNPAMFTGNTATNISMGQNKHSNEMDRAIRNFITPQQISAFLEIEQQNAVS
ncbi:unnamed protein product [Cercopithifilaria johnstoni]|uniref:Uncharacterized protein n=1 Tax=Cercopithifilaria johnstoni TaxID=2874296 RepID=A0A8J2MEX1_9BILA|nr:unnamed protein product [Cercopithifilaria johnstoni]